MNLDLLLKELSIMRPIEYKLKRIYEQNPERNLDIPNSKKSLADIFETLASGSDSDLMEKLAQQTLNEDDFFQKGADIALYRHLRYLPTYWHSHSFIEIICVFSGTCINYICDQEILLQAGDIFIIAPGTLHSISSFSDGSVIINIEIRTSTFETAFFGVLKENDILSDFFTHSLYHSPKHPYIFFRTNMDRELFDYVLYAYAEFRANHLYKYRMINNVIAAFFIILLRNHGTEVIIPSFTPSEGSENVVYLLKYIETNFNTITLSELAAFFNYSERQLQRILKKSTGLSFRDIIQKLKMNQAAALLRNPDLPISYIAEKLGYASVNNFRQIFKKYYELSPQEYREQDGASLVSGGASCGKCSL